MFELFLMELIQIIGKKDKKITLKRMFELFFMQKKKMYIMNGKEVK